MASAVPYPAENDNPDCYFLNTPIQFVGHFDNNGVACLFNTGDWIELAFEGRTCMPYIVGGPLPPVCPYTFDQIFFHWVDSEHSELATPDHGHKMEVHAVHYSSIYGCYEKAVAEPNGVAILVFTIGCYNYKEVAEFQDIVSGVRKIISIGDEATVRGDCLQWMQLMNLTDNYYTYMGNLPFAPGDDNIIWIVYRSTVYMSPTQWQAFEMVQSRQDYPKMKL